MEQFGDGNLSGATDIFHPPELSQVLVAPRPQLLEVLALFADSGHELAEEHHPLLRCGMAQEQQHPLRLTDANGGRPKLCSHRIAARRSLAHLVALFDGNMVLSSG